jgi:esterase
MKINFQFLNRKSNKNIILLHGILGNLKNLSSLANFKNIKTDYNVYLVDLRNHGSSFHSPNNTINEHAKDIIRFMDEQKLHEAHIIGHSFGAKVGIEMSLLFQGRLSSLIMLDMGPYLYGHNEYLNNMTYKYISKLRKINLNSSLRHIEEELLRIAENDKILAGFFMTNINHNLSGNFTWKCNLEAIYKNFEEVYSHVYPKNIFLKPALAIGGTKSDFIDPNNLEIFQTYFPNMNLKEDIKFVDAGHWVHYDKPVEVGSQVREFLDNLVN